MGSGNTNSKPTTPKSLLDESLDFGPDETPLATTDVQRLQAILKQIEDISARIDKLADEL